MSDKCIIIPIESITPPHGVIDTLLSFRLTESMRTRGWQGRPLLVVRYRNRFQALTGSHRWYAATQSNIAAVPCLVVENTRQFWKAIGGRRGWQSNDDLKIALHKIEDNDAMALLEEEMDVERNHAEREAYIADLLHKPSCLPHTEKGLTDEDEDENRRSSL